MLRADTKLRSSKYLNNLIEQDYRGVKQRIAVMLGFKGFRNAAITIAGIELLHRIRKGQFALGRLAFKAELYLQSGTRCFRPEVCSSKQGFLAPASYFAPEPDGGSGVWRRLDCASSPRSLP